MEEFGYLVRAGTGFGGKNPGKALFLRIRKGKNERHIRIRCHFLDNSLHFLKDRVGIRCFIFFDIVFTSGIGMNGYQHCLEIIIVLFQTLIIDAIVAGHNKVSQLFYLPGRQFFYDPFNRGIIQWRICGPKCFDLFYCAAHAPAGFIEFHRIGKGIQVIGIRQEIPLIIFCILAQVLFNGIVVQIGNGSPGFFITDYWRTAESPPKERAFALILGISLPGETASILLDKRRKIIF